VFENYVSANSNKIQEFINRDTTNVKYDVCDNTSNKWGHMTSNERSKEMFGSHTRKAFSIFTENDSYAWNITRNTESTAV
jgi:hypothetical protein